MRKEKKEKKKTEDFACSDQIKDSAKHTDAPSGVQAISMMEPLSVRSREYDQPVRSQMRRLLKEPTAKHSPLGHQDRLVMTWAFCGLL